MGIQTLMAQNKKGIVSSNASDIDQFLKQVDSSALAVSGDGRGRLIFAMDATASRQAAWDQAISLQSDMFQNTKGIGDLDVQLVYYRGMGECRASTWVNNASALTALMQKVSCLAGKTQIARILKHGIGEAKIRPVQALVFVGDCMEENIDSLGSLAGQLKLLGLPLFIFQEGNDPLASRAFADLAKLSGGAHCKFDQSSAAQLGQLLNAVAVYAAGGKSALKRLSGSSRTAALMLEQI